MPLTGRSSPAADDVPTAPKRARRRCLHQTIQQPCRDAGRRPRLSGCLNFYPHDLASWSFEDEVHFRACPVAQVVDVESVIGDGPELHPPRPHPKPGKDARQPRPYLRHRVHLGSLQDQPHHLCTKTCTNFGTSGHLDVGAADKPRLSRDREEATPAVPAPSPLIERAAASRQAPRAAQASIGDLDRTECHWGWLPWP